ncbi:Heterogeneous nuclear ribonucleoproteins A2/B1 [Glycine max]|nr:Heterogeneous nuclear ribonucleoproteins A2/B1 [Glycine max]
MPPKTAKRGSASSASKRGGRGGRGTPKAAQNQQQHETAEETVKVEEKQQPVVVVAAEEEQQKVVVEKEIPAVEENESAVVIEDKAIDMNQMAPEAVEETSHAASGLSLVKTVFIDALPPSWDEDYVRDLLRKYGEIEKIELARNMPAARRKDYGFVTFGSHDAAVKCADSITGTELGEGDKKAKVRARLSRPLQRGRGKHISRGDYRSSRGSGMMTRPSWSRPAPRSFPSRSVRGVGSRAPPVRPVSVRDRRPMMSIPARSRPVPPPSRSYDRRPVAPAYPKSSMKRDYGRREDIPPPRSRVAVDYGSRVASERRTSYRDYPARGPGYTELPRSTSRAAPRRGYVDDGYGQRFERAPPPPPPPHLSYREGRPRDYDALSGSKRSYAAIDDVPPRYADTGARQSRARLDYDYGGSASQYGDAYGDRLGRSSMGYGGGSRSSISSQDSHGLYSSRQGMSYGGGSFGSGDVGGMLVAAHIHQCILEGVWVVVAVIWVVADQDLIIEI